uniref:Protein WBSCR14 n=1 Tax=Ascaris suum TaxID=6253 RepID=F1KVG5_ASCSU
MTSHEPIHSGHFMTSNPHNDDLAPDEEDEDVEVEVVDDEEDRLVAEDDTEERRALKNQDEKPVTFYKFGPKKTQSIAIDVSLNKLNKCIKVAYNKMTTPKWKDFKGLRLHWKQRIRLNNVIWRAYYMEFRKPDKNKAKKTPYCYFAVPDDDTTHTKIEGSVMEGMYWKRRMEAVCAQYKRWRHFNKGRKKGRKRENSCSGESGAQKLPPKSQTPKNTSSEYFDIDDYDNEFTDTLFDSLSQPYMFPNPKEMVQGCNADVMQPGLLSLQPSIEEIMASFDPPPDPLQAGTDSAPPPSVSSSYSTKEYDAANLLVDYRSQTQPTRQPSTVSSQVLMVNSCAPTYSQAAYERIPPVISVPFSDTSNLDYVPQFLTTTSIPPTSTVLTNRSWWMNFPSTPTHSLLGSPSAPSPLMHSPTGPPSLTVNSPSSLLLPSPTETVRANTPSKGALKAYPNPAPPQKLTERWTTMANASMSSRSGVDTIGMGMHTPSPWKQVSTSPSVNTHSLPIPQPLYPQLSTHISSSSSLSMEQSTSVAAPLPSLIKEEEEKSDRRPHSLKGCESMRESSVFREHSLTSNTESRRILNAAGMETEISRRRSPRSAAADSTIEPVERKRILHLNAEKNRRSALKDGFEQLLGLLPNVYSAGTKPTNAVVLARAAERIRELRATITHNGEKADELQQQIQRLNDKIASLQASLPSPSRGGTTTVSQRTLVEQFFERYTKDRSRQDFRFWMMAKMMRPLIESLGECLCEDVTCRERVIASANDWLNANWQPSAMRPLASSMLIYLATNTSMLTNPSALQEHVQKEISKH